MKFRKAKKSLADIERFVKLRWVKGGKMANILGPRQGNIAKHEEGMKINLHVVILGVDFGWKLEAPIPVGNQLEISDV